jgi:NAD(P)-dependent dehydrogenase (short-subunit alcohol dehydrogenase family)
MSKSIAVFGAGPGLGQAVARRYAREGYAITLVARHSGPLDRLARDLTSAGATAHVITADLADTGATAGLADQIRAKAGNLDALYYAPTPNTGFVSAASLTPQHARNFMPLIFYAEMEQAKAVGDPVWQMPTVDPDQLADLLWTMHRAKGPREAIYPRHRAWRSLRAQRPRLHKQYKRQAPAQIGKLAAAA